MITKVTFKSIDELKLAQKLCVDMGVEVGVHNENGDIIDIKTFLGAASIALTGKPVNIVSESGEYHRKLLKFLDS